MLRNKLTQNSKALLQTAKRNIGQYGTKTYQTGLERLILDKFTHMRALSKVSLFSLFGLANGLCYGLSHVMKEKDYVYYFGYKGDGRLSSLTRSMFGSNVTANAVWTVPSLLFFGQYMHNKVGAMTMLKFTPIALFGIMSFMTAFSPNEHYRLMPNVRLLGGVTSWMNWDAIGNNNEYYMGADQLCQSIIYFTMLYHRLWTPAIGFAIFDLFYYGPMTLGGPMSAFMGAMTLL